MATINQLAKGVPFTRVENQLISPMSDVTAVHALSLLEAALRDKLQNGQKNPAPIYHLSSKDAFPSIEICMMLYARIIHFYLQIDSNQISEPEFYKVLPRK